MTALTGNIVMY